MSFKEIGVYWLSNKHPDSIVQLPLHVNFISCIENTLLGKWQVLRSLYISMHLNIWLKTKLPPDIKSHTYHQSFGGTTFSAFFRICLFPCEKWHSYFTCRCSSVVVNTCQISCDWNDSTDTLAKFRIYLTDKCAYFMVIYCISVWNWIDTKIFIYSLTSCDSW